MRKKLFWVGVVLLILGVLAFTFNNVFEIVETGQRFPPSREAQINDYLALDRWLAAEGHPVRVLSTGGLYTLQYAQEGTFLIQSDLFDWNNETTEFLESWVEKGGSLVLCLMFYRSWREDDELGAFLIRLGIEPGEQPDNSYDAGFPSFGRNIHIKEPEDESAFVLKDSNGLVRLVQIPRGSGTITVTGRPRFMTTSGLNFEANARLSWYLLAGDNKTPGVLFIRGYARPQGLMGRIFQQGNFIIIIISGLVLIVAGFWSLIPVFGIVRGSEERPGKTLAERFLAEGRFLRRFGALEHYRAIYMREIRRRLMKRNLADEELISHAAALLGPEQIPAAEDTLTPGPQKNKNFLESIIILKTILERL